MKIVTLVVIKIGSLVFRNNPLGEMMFMVAFIAFINAIDKNMIVKQMVK